jgi:hypothetical protein
VLSIVFALQLAAAAPPPAPARDVGALVARVRAARYQQDSTLASYQAIARQRMSATIGLTHGIAIGIPGRERLFARFESVAREGWHHERGAWAEIIGARSVVPMLGTKVEPEADETALVLPYYPGRDRLWPIDEVRNAMHEPRDWIEHPLAPGADSLYVFSRGDSLTMRLPDGTQVRVIELRVRARRPDSRLVVGSLWVDAASGALVRAVYRPSVPMDLWPLLAAELDDAEDSTYVRKLGPFTGTVREVIVENGLYLGRFWLPRVRVAHAEGTAKLGRLSVDIEQTFAYEHVAAVESGVASLPPAPAPDIDPRDGRVRRPEWRGSERGGRCHRRGDPPAGSAGDSLLVEQDLKVMYADGVRYRVLMPCNDSDLVTTRELPPSLFSPDEQLFTDTDLRGLRANVDQALGISRQSEYKPQPFVFEYGWQQLRYNRVEGLSAAARATRSLGNGYDEGATIRVGTADLHPNAEVWGQRSNVRSTLRLTGYHRLVASNDWGDPLSTGASISALLFARDDGFYYRTSGVDLSGSLQRVAHGAILTWRAFGERQDSTRLGTRISLAHIAGRGDFLPNVQALAGNFVGGAATIADAWGANPNGVQLAVALRGEGAGGAAKFGRGSAEGDLSLPLGRVAASITGSAGSSVGAVPPQRLWFLGGVSTVRGHPAGAAAGDAYWFGRVELSGRRPLFHPVVFADAGFAGSRDAWNAKSGRLCGAGVGMTALAGLVRLDVSRGLEPVRGWRTDVYFELR